MFRLLPVQSSIERLHGNAAEIQEGPRLTNTISNTLSGSKEKRSSPCTAFAALVLAFNPMSPSNPLQGLPGPRQMQDHRRHVPAMSLGEKAVFTIPKNYSKWCGPAATSHFSYASLEDVFGTAFANEFHTSPAFRSDLCYIAPGIKALFAVHGFESPSWKCLNDEDVSEAYFSEDWDSIVTQNRDVIQQILQGHLGENAPSPEQFVKAFADLCGEKRRGSFTALGAEPPSDALEWHQDWGPPDEESFTVMLGFPPADKINYEGVGILTELVRLSHRFNMEEFRQGVFPLSHTGTDYTAEQALQADRKGLEALGISDAYRVQPVFKRGQEFVIYRDAEHLHRGPTSDVLQREACWRFQ